MENPAPNAGPALLQPAPDDSQHQLFREATRDRQTQLYNRLYFEDRLEAEFSFAERHQAPLTLMLVELDPHEPATSEATDNALVQLANLTVDALRSEDLAARSAKQQLALLVRSCPAEDAFQLADRLRRKIEELAAGSDGGALPFRVSIGMATLLNGSHQSTQAFLAAARENAERARLDGAIAVRPEAHPAKRSH